ncbi:serine/threonine protein kinase [Nonomuraea sp. NN258]|nr:serine/threonine protein kinase [Nonomuraea antri]
MGKVWLAKDEMLDREVAVKELTMPEGLPPGQRAELVTRAVREAQATARLRHPGIVALHDVIVEGDRPWLVMELLRGRTLHDTVREFGPMPHEHAARIGADVLDALSAAHAQGLQHRDVKPGNVFLTDSGRVVLTDFGIARQEGQATLTEQGLTIGSPGFIAPERLEGEPGGPAADLWSLGATLFLAATGTPAYEGSPTERIKDTLTRPVPVTHPPLGPLLTAMMARRPEARPDARSTLAALRQVAQGQTPQLPGHELTAPSRVKRRGRTVAWIAAATALVVAAAAAGFLLLRNRESGTPTAFTAPMDVCALLTSQEAGQLLRTKQPPKPQPDADEVGPSCGWPISGSAGVGLQVQKDSDTRDPWSMTPASAHTLFENQRRYWGKYTSLEWNWPEIGVTKNRAATLTPPRELAGVGEEAFAFELKGPSNRVHTAMIFYRLANLVVKVEYTTLGDRLTDDDVKQTALTAARATEQALRRAT